MACSGVWPDDVGDDDRCVTGADEHRDQFLALELRAGGRVEAGVPSPAATVVVCTRPRWPPARARAPAGGPRRRPPARRRGRQAPRSAPAPLDTTSRTSVPRMASPADGSAEMTAPSGTVSLNCVSQQSGSSPASCSRSIAAACSCPIQVRDLGPAARPEPPADRADRDGQQQDDGHGEAGAAATDVLGTPGRSAGGEGIGRRRRRGRARRPCRAACWCDRRAGRRPSTSVPGSLGCRGRVGRLVGRSVSGPGGAAAGGHGHRLDAEVLAQVGELGQEGAGVDRPAGRVAAGGAGDQLVDLPRQAGHLGRRLRARRGARAGTPPPAGCRRRTAGAPVSIS